MQIGIVTRNLIEEGGGIENYLNPIFMRLSMQDSLHVLTQRFENEKFSVPYRVEHPAGYSFLAFWLWTLANRRRLFEESDLIVSGSALTAPLIKGACKPKACFVYGLDLMYPNPVYQRWFPPALKHMDSVLACSAATRELCIQRGVSPAKVHVAYPGVDSKRFAPDKEAGYKIRQRLQIPDEAPVVFSVSRHVRRKGILRLVRDIAPALVRDNKNIRIVVGGQGPLTPEIKETVAKLGLSENVFLVGYIPDAELPAYYNMADVFALPEEPVAGDFEGFGIVHLEASACGVPSVGSHMEAATEAIEHGVRGVACDPYDLGEHVRNIKKFLADKSYREDFSSRCRERILESWTIENSASVAAEMVRSVAGHGD